MAPSRLLDTRVGGTPVDSSNDRTVIVAGKNGVPADATGVVVNTTGVAASQSLNLEMYPTGAKPSPRTSVLDLQDEMGVADLVIMPIGRGGGVNLSANTGHSDIVLDVMGYITN